MTKQPIHTKITLGVIGALALMSGSVAMAGSLTIPNTFTGGTPAVAADVNANFSAGKTAIDDNDSRITINTGDITTNAGGITLNTGNISTNTSGVAANASAISGLGGGSAAPVTVTCADAGAIQAAIDNASPHGRLTITVNGACTDNVVINRSKVTLIGGTNAATDSIVGLTTSPTISSTSKTGLVIENITIGGGSQAVFAYAGAKLKVKNATIGDGATLGNGVAVAMGSIARFYGGSGGTIVNGGTEIDESTAVSVVGNSTVQFVDGNTVINAGTESGGLSCELAGSITVGDFTGAPHLTINGDGFNQYALDVFENCYVGMFNGVINGDMEIGANSTLTIEAYAEEAQAVTATGFLSVDSGSNVLLDGDTVSLVGDARIQRLSVMNLREGATVTGGVQIRASSGLDIQPALVGAISGELGCDDFTGNYIDVFPQQTDVAGSYRVNGVVLTTEIDHLACGFLYPNPPL